MKGRGGINVFSQKVVPAVDVAKTQIFRRQILSQDALFPGLNSSFLKAFTDDKKTQHTKAFII